MACLAKPLAFFWCLTLLSCVGKGIQVEEVAGDIPENKARRSALFAISGKGAVYPQFFLQLGEDQPTCVGDYEEFEGLVECETMDAAVLAENPDIPTFSKTFATLLAARNVDAE
eukprot:COSAG02_NODE_7186_length_3120_cov_2.863172_2_plen_114_part_00